MLQSVQILRGVFDGGCRPPGLSLPGLGEKPGGSLRGVGVSPKAVETVVGVQLEEDASVLGETRDVWSPPSCIIFRLIKQECYFLIQGRLLTEMRKRFDP